MICGVCGKKNRTGNVYCSGCGKALAESAQYRLGDVPPPKWSPLHWHPGVFLAILVAAPLVWVWTQFGDPEPRRTPDAPPQTHHLIGKAVSFSHDSDSTPAEETQADAEVEKFAHFLMRSGARPLSSNLMIQVEPDCFDADGHHWYSHYMPRLQLTRIARAYLPDADILDKEYVHVTLQQNQPRLFASGATPEAWDIEDATARFYACSFHGRSRFAATTERTVNGFEATEFANTLIYSDLSGMGVPDNTSNRRSRFWGGVLWDLRQELPSDRDGNRPADALVIAAWKSLTQTDLDADDTGARFSSALQKQDRELFDGAHLSAIRTVFRRRGLLPKSPERPDQPI